MVAKTLTTEFSMAGAVRSVGRAAAAARRGRNQSADQSDKVSANRLKRAM